VQTKSCWFSDFLRELTTKVLRECCDKVCVTGAVEVEAIMTIESWKVSLDCIKLKVIHKRFKRDKIKLTIA
jgi:hypothetical protein